MAEITATTAQHAPAQVGNGRTVHLTDAETVSTETLCGRTVTRVLTPEQAEKKNKPCRECARAAEEIAEAARLAADAEEAAESAEAGDTPAEVGEPAEVQPEEEDEAPAVEVEEPAEAEPEELEEAPAAEDAEPAEDTPAGQAEVTAYTAAMEQLFLNGTDKEDRALYVDADTVLEAIAGLRRMPRWNAKEERFTVNKVALILVRDDQGERVWVRGETDPIRVDLAGAPVDADAPAEVGPVDMAAVLAATRLLRRRREVQRVIDNREAARATSTPAPMVEEPAAPTA
ncbi:hypothetical protein [Streptomyces sp. TRM68367]|uniref:hypothetical protein n=1 Tax=Streptomyces sp. TRM68367 TaxID=2758415 RepID=UPI00165B3C0F|nr:hypothetical protein [Streptomyces sp. TRM68367]MBC9730695.1 hypothetical protein [Streptomyces sp. TRM68367]